MAPDEAMLDGVRAARRAGVRTGLLSNSWGDAPAYDRALLEELFDAWVISSEVGLRKPDPAIYALAAERARGRRRRASSSTTCPATSSPPARSGWPPCCTAATRRPRLPRSADF